MRKRPRTLAIFSLSALDVLAMSTGVFVLLLVMLMPYYRKTFDAGAEIEAVRSEAARIEQDAERARTTAESQTASNIARLEQIARITEESERLERRIAQAHPTPPPVPRTGNTETQSVNALDLIFVVDTTASMNPVLREMAVSMRSIARILQRLVPSVKIGVIAYRDRDTGLPPVQVFPPTATDRRLDRIIAFLERLTALRVGSRTVEEDVYLGLQAALAMPLRPRAQQSIVVIGDAAAHPDEVSGALDLARTFAAQGPRHTVSALFVSTPNALRRGQIDRRFFRDLARAGHGVLTDHAGSMVASVLLSVLKEQPG